MSVSAEGVAEVSTWAEFVTAYNDATVKKIVLLSNIEQASGATLSGRREPLVIDGVNYNKLDLRTTRLSVGSPSAAGNVLKFENIILSNYTASEFINVDTSYKWVFHFNNVKTAPSVSAPADGAGIMRLSQAHSTVFIFEGDIDITTRAEFAEPGSVLIKEGTNFKGHQERKTGSLAHSAFWFAGISSVAADKDRYFRVEDNVNITMIRDVASLYPPVYQQFGEMTVGNNVKWHQENYQNFISDYWSTGVPKTIKFGKRNNIVAVNSTLQSIDLQGSNHSVEFGPGSSLKIQGQGNILNLTGTNNRIVFRNPVGLDLETTGGLSRVFNMSSTSNVEFQYVTLSTWNPGTDVSGPASAEFAKVTNTVLKGGATGAIANVTSDNNDLITHFRANNSKRILTEKIPIGQVAVSYVNQFGDTVGEPQVIEIPDSEAYVVDEAVTIPDSLRTNPAIPAGYHYATADELVTMGKTQPEYAFTGMEGVNDPRITEIYVYSDKTDFKVNFINALTEENVAEAIFNKFVGETVNLSDAEFTNSIPEGLRYAEESDLKEGQTQTSTIKVEKDGSYTVYVVETQELIDARSNAKAEIDEAAEAKKQEITDRTDVSDEEKEAAKAKVEEERTKGHTAVDNSKTVGEVTTAKDTAIEEINKVTPKTIEEELQEAKDKAKEEIDEAAEAKKQEITDRTDISDKSKEEAIAKVEEERTKGHTEVDNSTTIDEVTTAKDTAIEEINKVTPKTTEEELQEAKDKAKEEIDEAAEAKKKEITDRTDISDKSKEEAIAKVEEEREKGHTEVDNSTTIDEVTTAKDTAIEEINKVTPKTTEEELQEAKDKAKAEIDEAAEAKKQEITDRTDVSDEEKEKAIAKVEEEREKGHTEVDNSTTIDEVTTAKDTAIEEINKVTPKTIEEELQEAKDKAKAEINQAAEDKKSTIDSLEGVSQEAKDEAKAKVEEERTKGHTAVDESTTIDEVTTAKDTAIEEINKVTPKTTVARGDMFPDAIVGAPYAAKNKYPIVLSRPTEVPKVVLDYISGK
ncbi:DUF1542 domain-containing protein [Miniphocaeibacter massiliensis]|uniref:DUF1542 domain-containing protein n=1 Tax=Miniphocaeibacter massiliensis TaxID=2041841 RepID=UPI003BF49874